MVSKLNVIDLSTIKKTAIESPRQTGSHSKLSSPSLEFIKSVCHVLALDRTFASDIEVIRISLLKEIGIKAFSDDSDYRDPCSSYVLPGIMCTFCGCCHDIDLLRDSHFSSSPDREYWPCLQCGTDLKRARIEHRLLIEAERLLTHFLLQDFRCDMTRLILVRLCTTSSDDAFQADMVPTDIEAKRMRLSLKKVATWHKFKLLECILDIY
jgi:hypothetical protein